jgi:hypothetical protein
MKRKMLLAAACAAALWSATAMALPSVDDVSAAARSGDYPKAESMMREVVAAKPTSAKAHYVLAEILSKEHKFDDAAAEAHKAREIDPDLKFAGKDPEKFRTFERELQREQTGANTPVQAAPARVVPAPAVPQAQAPAPAPASSGGGIPGWVWVVGLAVVAFMIFRAVTRRALANNMAAAGYGNAGGYGMAPGQPQPGYGPGYSPGYGQSPGSGLLRTGLAAAGGVAGGMLLEKMLEDRRHDDNTGGNYGGGNYGGGGSFSDADQAVRDLDNRPIDFGSGGNDWGGDAGGGFDGGGGDSGGSSDGGW